ncbi:GntP family permease [Gymnodinialimonas sp. 2305UL16-5]|uniref:GntP family permease n=1 Tax=Gymnodinialimonas mytili TaxID=3126503 RepID=UPI003095EC88
MGIDILTTLIAPLGLLIWLAYRGLPVMVLAPLCAGLAALIAGDPVLATLTQRFMPALGQFVIAFFPLFLLGAIFGRLMEVTGAATAIAEAIIRALGTERAILAVVLACAILTYGGVSLFVVAFAVFPLAMALFSAAKLPMQLIPAAIALGAFTFTMTALPGTPAIQNAIPMAYFGTNLYAAPGLGVLAAVIMFGGGLAYCGWAARRMVPLYPDWGTRLEQRAEAAPLGASLLPIATVLALNLVLVMLVFPRLDLTFLADPRWGGIEADTITGVWALIVSLSAAIVLLCILLRTRLAEGWAEVGRGAEAALGPLFNTASLVGFGAVIAALPAFDALREAIDAVPGGPVIGLALSAAILAGITGSASGGMTIALDTLGAEYLEAGQAQGVAPGVLHRVTALATGGLDALPHNGAVVTLLNISGFSHRQAYGPIFVVAVVIPTVALAIVLLVDGLM